MKIPYSEDMKILCVSDHVDPLVYSATIKTRFSDVSLVLSSGDLPFNYYDYIISSLNKPLLFVFGNHKLDMFGYFKKTSDISSMGKTMVTYFENTSQRPGGVTYVGDRIVKQQGLLIAGLGGSMWYNGKPNQYTDFTMYLHILRFLPRLLLNRIFRGRYVDILITHAPPFRVNDLPDRCHTGFKAFLWFMRVFKPRYLVHGHVHLYDMNARRVSNYCETKVVNVYDHYVIDWEDNSA